jgi:electron transfer flavoprotein alpha subunit
VDLTRPEVIVAVGRGIQRNPTLGVRLGVELAQALGGDVGISRGVVTSKYPVDASVDQFTKEVRQIGETGQVVKPRLYVALGISGAIQHKKGMDKSRVIVAVNPDESAPIKEFSDVFIKGDLFEVVPKIREELARVVKASGNGNLPPTRKGGAS